MRWGIATSSVSGRAICNVVIVMRWLLLLFFLFTSIGCGQSVEEPLRIVSSPWPGYEPLYLARDLGYLKQRNIKLIELPSSNVTYEAFRNGSADVATLTFDETATLLAQGRHLRILAVMDVSNGGDAVVVRPEITSLSELKGKRITMVNIPLGAYLLQRMLDSAGLTADEVLLSTSPEDKHLRLYQEQKIDAAVTFEPYKSKLIEEGAHVLFDSSMMPNEIFDLLVVNDKAFRKHREALCDLVMQWNRAIEYVYQYPEDAAKRMAGRLAMTPDAFLKAMSGLYYPTPEENYIMLGGDSPRLIHDVKNAMDIMVKEGMLIKEVDIASAIDPSFQECL